MLLQLTLCCMVPLDMDSKLQIVEIVPESSSRTDIVLSNMVQKQVEEFIKLIKNDTELELAGLNIRKSLLLYGASGMWKDSIAITLVRRQDSHWW